MDAKSVKSDKPMSGFVIKLSTETVQKLAEEDQQARSQEPEVPSVSIVNQETSSTVTEIAGKEEQSEHARQENQETDKEVKSSDIPSLPDEHKKDCTENSKAQLSKAKDNAETDPKSDDSNPWGEYAPYITYEGDQAIYTDPSTQQRYTWNKDTNAWDPAEGQSDVPGRVYSYEDDTHIYTEPDGTKFFWDPEKKAWIPKVDDDFLAFYQMSYGFVDNTSKAEEAKEEANKKEAQKKAESAAGVKRKSEPQWFDASDETNTKVYVSNLPLDLTQEEFVNFMQKCGLVERDPSTQKMKVKMYMDKEHDCFKGDALCTYIKIESVDLALKLLDGADLKGHKVRVERAHFQLKGEYNPALKPKKKKKKELEKIKKMQQKLFDWRPEKFIGERSKHERVVIIKNLFHPTDFDKEVQLILDYQQDLREECSKVGEVRKVVIYDRHPEGVAQVTMKEPEMADAAVQLINGRWFGKRQITAEIWDGKTKYKIAETDADINQRVNKWEKFLEGKEEEDKNTNQEKEKNAPAVAAETITVSKETENTITESKEDKL